MIDGEYKTIDLWEGIGGGDYEPLSELTYGQTDIFFVCFSVSDPISFANIKKRWIPELNTYWKDVPKFLVGTKSDTREDEETIKKLSESGLDFVSKKEADELVSELGFIEYMETSSTLNQNVNEVFVNAVRFLSPKKKNCLLQ